MLQYYIRYQIVLSKGCLLSFCKLSSWGCGRGGCTSNRLFFIILTSAYFLWTKGVCLWGVGKEGDLSDAAALVGVAAGAADVGLDALDDV